MNYNKNNIGIFMGSGSVIIIISLVIVICYILWHYGALNTPSNNLPSTGSALSNIVSSPSSLSNCTSEVESKINIISAKAPQGSIVAIVNSTIFYKKNYSITQSEINNWIHTWTVADTELGAPVSMNCINQDSLTYNYYICKDSFTVLSQLNDTSSIVAIGIAVKIYEPQGQVSTRIYPTLCNYNGTLLSNSSAWLNGVS